jgi:hypothetical protein
MMCDEIDVVCWCAAPFAGSPLGSWPPDLNLADGIGVPSKKNSQHQPAYQVFLQSFFYLRYMNCMFPPSILDTCKWQKNLEIYVHLLGEPCL